eukprot:7821739-Pyramimonas_sp.AAC.1
MQRRGAAWNLELAQAQSDMMRMLARGAYVLARLAWALAPAQTRPMFRREVPGIQAQARRRGASSWGGGGN